MGGLGNITIQDVLVLIQPDNFFDYVLYAILLFSLITLFMQGEGALTITLMLAVVVVAIFIDKVGALPGHPCGVFTLLFRILYFVIPLLTAGVTRVPNSRVWAIIAAVLGLFYTFALWALEMRNPAICRPLARDLSMFLESIIQSIV
ncbi:MAG: hypothetical protein JXN59_12595 [Anaerolineae bacterium]|nr:hypothetical protein [Anaerolineae bacterium]